MDNYLNVNRPLFSSEINYFFKKNNKFKGVFACNNIKYKKIDKKNHQIFIINLDKYNEKGSHWVGLSINKSNTYYFDSFGLKLYNKYILNLKKKKKIKKISYSNKLIQKITDVNCGHYCIGFVIFISHFNSLKKYLNCFSNNTKKNSIIIKKIIKKYINYIKKNDYTF